MRNRSDLVPFLTTLLVGGMLVGGVRTVWPVDACGPEASAAQTEPQLGSASIRVLVLSSSNKAGVLAEMACRFERSAPEFDGRAIDVVISSEASGAAYDQIGALKPTVWSPAATSWVNMLRAGHPEWVPAPENIRSIAQSPQVIAMPRPMAEALDWPAGSLGWSDIDRFATDPAAWEAAIEQPRWGSFKLGKTNPRLSTSGLNSTVATFKVATETASDLQMADVTDPKVLAFVHDVESATVHYAPTSVDFLRNLRAQDDLGKGEGYVSAILLEEKSVWDYNHGNPSGDPATLGQNPAPATPLAAFYPEEGALVADHPYVVMSWARGDARSAAERFLDFLLAPAQQELFQALGYRDAAGNPGSEINEGNGLLRSAPASELSPPSGEVLKAIRRDWPAYRKQARVLIVMDVSGSMSSPVAGGSDRTKLELAQAAALRAIRQLGPSDEVGLWTFSPSSSSAPYVEQVPIGQVSTNGATIRRAIRGLSVERGNRSELYASVQAAVAEMRSGIDTTKINGIVLLSDGPDEGGPNPDASAAEGDALLSEVEPLQDQQEVRLFTIAYGENADTEWLASLAHASLGTPYLATDPSDIGKVFYQVVANF